MQIIGSSESEWRLSLAQAIAPAYAANRHVVAVFAFGSACYGFADRFSDLEMGIIWSEPPSEDAFREAARRMGDLEMHSAIYLEDKQAWSEEYLVEGVRVEFAHWTRSTIETVIADVIERYDVSQNRLVFEKQAIIATLQRATVYHGEGVIATWRDQVKSYPDELAIAMIEKNLQFGSFGGREMLAERKEIPLLYEHHCRLVRQLVNILFGLNRIYHPSFKWTRYFVEEMPLKPPQFFVRIEQVFQSELTQGTGILRSLIEETFDLIEQNLPQIDLQSHRKEFAQPYPIQHRPHPA